MVIMHNMEAMNASRQVNIGNNKKAKSTERLSSGYRINRAADDAAGLMISEKMRWQIRGLNRASDNSEEGISYIRTADGALEEMHSLMQRCRELCVQAANDTNTEADRDAVQKEIDQVTKEIDRISSTTQYNTLNIFSTDGLDPFALQGAGGINNFISVTMQFIDKDGNVLTPDNGNPGNATNYTGDNATIARYVADQAALAAGAILAAYPALAGASSSGLKVGLNLADIDGSGNVLASAQLSMSWGSDTTMTYTMNVDTSDYNINNYNDGTLAATIAHEMTHLVMQDTLTAGMLSKNSEPYPKWFVEGAAQTASGDDGWLTNYLNGSSSDATIQAYLSKTSSMPYGAGYLNTLYLAQMASGQSTVSTGSLQAGMNTIFSKLVTGSTLSQVISEISNGKYTDYHNFENNVASDADALQFTKDFIAARGGNGAGSVVAANLSTVTKDILGSAAKYTTSYTIDTSTTAYANHFSNGFTFPDKGKANGTGGGGTGTGGTTNNGGMLYLQVGAQGGQYVALNTYDVSSDTLFKGRTLDVMSFEKATKSIDIADEAIDGISAIRSYYGAIQNRLEKTVSNLENTKENTQAAESKIRDTDMAEEMVSNSSADIIAQAAQAMLAQANQIKEGILQLLQ